jgi:hypothetical protein
VGAFLSFVIFRRLFLFHLEGHWVIADLIVIGFVSAYFIFLAIRVLRWSMGRPSDEGTKIKWGRVVLGLVFTYGQIKVYAFPDAPTLLQPSNETQALTMKVMGPVMVLIGLWLFVSGFAARFNHRGSSGSETGSEVISAPERPVE